MSQPRTTQRRRYSLKTQIFLVLCVSIFLLAVLITFIFLNHEKQNLIDSAIDHNLSLIQQTSLALDNHLTQLDAMARTIGNSAYVDSILQTSTDSISPLEYAQNLGHVRDILTIYTINNPSIHITIFDADKIAPTLSSNHVLNQEYDFTQDAIYTAFQNSSDDMLILHDNPQHYLTDPSDSGICTFAYRLRSRYSQNPIGYMLVDIQMDSLQEYLSFGSQPNWTGTILTADGSTLIQYGPPIAAADIQAATNHNRPDAYYIISDKNILFTTQLDFSGWTILSSVDYQSILGSTTALHSLIPIALIVMPILVIGIALFLSKYFSAPIITLTNSIQAVQQGNLTTITTIHRSDELGLLAQQFNKMLENIRALIKKNEEEAALRQKAQLQELQNRINPHFVYNTLEMIAGLSTTPSASCIRGICNHLSNMMRYSLLPETIVPLKDELAQAEDYLAIMQQRFDNLFSYDIQILDPSILDEPFCKMVLQPLIENTIKHGFRNINHNGIICITLGRQQNCFYCLIQDNGCGIPRDTLDALLAVIKNSTISDETLLTTPHHGMLNVYTRLLMQFGDRLEFRLASRENGGTSITILVENEN